MARWQDRMADYLAATARHDEAERLMARAERIFSKLARTLDDDRAYEIAGVGLADNRSLRAYAEKRRAFTALRASVADAGLLARMTAAGAVQCAGRAANDAGKPAGWA